MVWFEKDEQARGAKGAAKDWRFAAPERNESARSNFLPIEESLDNKPRTPEDKRPTLDDKRTKEGVIDGFLVAHSAKLEPEGDGWLLRYPLARANLQERHFGSVEASLLIIGESRKDALMIAELVLRDHEPPELPTEPTIEPSPPPTKFAMRCSIDPTRGQDRLRPSDMNAGLSH